MISESPNGFSDILYFFAKVHYTNFLVEVHNICSEIIYLYMYNVYI